jgi:hypothetical protein
MSMHEDNLSSKITAGQSNILAPFRKAFSQTKQKVTIIGNNPEPVVLTLDFTQQGNGR